MTRELLILMNAEQSQAFARLVESAERGDGDAACRLGDMYREGLGGLRYSPKETYRWYARSAMAGDANGQSNLGACYEHGLGCVQSYTKAAKWYRLAATRGLGTAAMNLGYHYLRGHGVPRDTAEALRLFRVAVERGEERAALEVARLEIDRDVESPKGVSSGPQLVSTEACPRGHAVNPSVGSRIRLSLPHDGPRDQLRHSHAAAAASNPQDPDAERTESPIDHARPRLVPNGTNAIAADGPRERPQASMDRPRPRIRFVDETQREKHLGLVGGVDVEPSRLLVDGGVDRSTAAVGSACPEGTEGEM